jgi:AcrR family transcriptional regulator
LNNTKSLIEQAAIKEFMDKGFNCASLRKIVRNAGLTTGAFYKYYPNKEALFADLVEEHADYIYSIYDNVLKNFEALPASEQPENMKDTSQGAISEMLAYIYAHYDNFKLLICKSEGTPFACFIHNLVEKEVAATDRFIVLMKENGIDVPDIDPELNHMLASGMFSGIFEIVVHDMEETEAIKKVKKLKDFYTAGWENLMGIKF